MSRDDMIRMAEAVGVKEYGPMSRNWSFKLSQLERFAQLVAAQAAAEEREACAEVCKEIADSEKLAWHEITATACARAIRNRGTA